MGWLRKFPVGIICTFGSAGAYMPPRFMMRAGGIGGGGDVSFHETSTRT